jgi:hypothetical protein
MHIKTYSGKKGLKMRINNIAKKGLLTLALVFPFTSVVSANVVEDKYSFIKEKLIEDKKCEACLTLTQPTVLFDEEQTIFSYRANVEKTMFTEINTPEGFKVDDITVNGQKVDYFWGNNNTLMIEMNEGVHDIEITGDIIKDFSIGFDFKPIVVNKTEQDYRIQGNTLSVMSEKVVDEGIIPNSYEGYFLVNTNIVLENDRYEISHEVSRSQLGGNKSTDIEIPKMMDGERLKQSNATHITQDGDSWNISIPNGLNHFNFTTTSEARKDVKVSLSPQNNYFQSIVFITAPNYQLYKGEEVVDMALLNTSDKNEETISFEDVNIAEASETLLKDIKHNIKETPYGYEHNISFSASSSSPSQVNIGVNTRGSLKLINGNNYISLKDNNIVIRSNTLSNSPKNISLSFEETVSKNSFMKKPANIEFENVSGYSVVFNKSEARNLIAWIVGDFEGKAQSPLILIALLSIIASLATIKRGFLSNSRENNIVIVSLPIFVVLSLLHSSFFFATVALAMLFFINKQIHKIESNEVFQTVKILSLFILVGYLFLVNTLQLNYSGIINTLSIIASNNIFLHSFYETRSISIIEIPFAIVLLAVSIPILMLMVINLMAKQKAKNEEE